LADEKRVFVSAKIRVFELAEKLGKDPQALREELGKMGKPVHSNLSLVDAVTAEAMLAAAGGGKAAPAPKAAKVAVAEAPASAAPAEPAKPEEKSGVTIKFAIPKRKVKVVEKAEAPAAPAKAAAPAAPAEGGTPSSWPG
jgi:hypothetical protein